MRAIDADALIALVQDSTILGDGFKQAFCALVNGEPTIEPEPKWIPCSERLPENGGWYIVTRILSKDDFKWVGLQWFSRLNGWEWENPTAWMPLPEPYRKEGEE